MTDTRQHGEACFIPIEGQCFFYHEQWVTRASRDLTAHPDYHNTEHDGPDKGWRGAHFTALCFDQLGRRCRNGADFKRAQDDCAFPVWWVWPDQIVGLVRGAVSGDIPRKSLSEDEREKILDRLVSLK